MDIFLALFTYFAYVFIVVLYSVKALKYLGVTCSPEMGAVPGYS